jgi:hypothetical protein
LLSCRARVNDSNVTMTAAATDGNSLTLQEMPWRTGDAF